MILCTSGQYIVTNSNFLQNGGLLLLHILKSNEYIPYTQQPVKIIQCVYEVYTNRN